MVIDRQKLRQIRQQRGMSQAQLARVVGVPANYTSRWENHNTPNGPHLIKLLDALGCTLDDITTEDTK